MKQRLIARAKRTFATYTLAIIVLLGGVTMLSALAPIVYAASVPNVLFNGTTQTFTFQNVTTTVDSTGERVPDLFASLKSIVPGDSITQNIILSVRQIPSDQQVTIYLQAQSENDDYTALLESATLQVVHDGEEITQSLAQPVVLGVFDSAQTKETTVTLTVPISVGNEISGLNANIDWVFSAEYAPEDEANPVPTATPSISITSQSQNQNSPKTGDANLWWLWVVLCVSAVWSIAIVVDWIVMHFKSKS